MTEWQRELKEKIVKLSLLFYEDSLDVYLSGMEDLITTEIKKAFKDASNPSILAKKGTKMYLSAIDEVFKDRGIE